MARDESTLLKHSDPTRRISNIGFAQSKWPHLHRAYVIGVCILFVTAVRWTKTFEFLFLCHFSNFDANKKISGAICLVKGEHKLSIICHRSAKLPITLFFVRTRLKKLFSPKQRDIIEGKRKIFKKRNKVCKNWDRFGLFWTNLYHFRQDWINLEKYGQIWTSLDQFRKVLNSGTIFNKIRQIWSNFDQFWLF